MQLCKKASATDKVKVKIKKINNGITLNRLPTTHKKLGMKTQMLNMVDQWYQ